MFSSVEEHLTEFLWLINSTQNLTAFTLSIYRRTFDNLRKDVLLLVHVPPSAKGVCLPVCGALGTKYRKTPQTAVRTVTAGPLSVRRACPRSHYQRDLSDVWRQLGLHATRSSPLTVQGRVEAHFLSLGLS